MLVSRFFQTRYKRHFVTAVIYSVFFRVAKTVKITNSYKYLSFVRSLFSYRVLNINDASFKLSFHSIPLMNLCTENIHTSIPKFTLNLEILDTY